MYQHVDASHVKVDGRENKFITETKKSPREDHREDRSSWSILPTDPPVATGKGVLRP